MEIHKYQKLRDEKYCALCEYYNSGQLDKAEKFIEDNQYFLGFKKFGKAFVLSCQSGNIEMAKWLVSFNDDKNEDGNFLNCPTTCKLVLTLSYEAGHIDIVMWFLTLNNKEGIHGDNEYVFRMCCEMGYLELAQILLEHEPNTNIRAMDDYSLKACCLGGYIEMAQWLARVDTNLPMLIGIRESPPNSLHRSKKTKSKKEMITLWKYIIILFFNIIIIIFYIWICIH